MHTQTSRRVATEAGARAGPGLVSQPRTIHGSTNNALVQAHGASGTARVPEAMLGNVRPTGRHHGVSVSALAQPEAAQRPSGQQGISPTYVSQAARKTLFDTSVERVVEADAQVQGSFPAWLKGTVVANGGGEFAKMEHLFDGYSLISRIKLHGGEGGQGRVSASQRFLQSEAYTHYKATGKMKFREFVTALPSANALEYAQNVAANTVAIVTKQGGFTDNASVNLIPLPTAEGSAQAGQYRLLALSESLPSSYLVDARTAATVAPQRYNDDVAGDLTTAHPKVLRDGRLVNFSRSLPMGGFHVYVQDPVSLVRKQIAFIRDRDGLSPSWVHDLSATEHYVVICETPLHFNMPALMLGGERDYAFMDWRPEAGTRVHVVALDGSGVRTYDAPTFFTFHYGNAYEETIGGPQGTVVLHVDMAMYKDPQIVNDLNMDKLKQWPGGEVSESYWRRLSIPLPPGPFTPTNPLLPPQRLEQPRPLLRDEGVYGRFAEFPAFNQAYRGRAYRYLYGTAAVRPTHLGNALAKHDLQAGTSQVWHENGAMPAEPVFVARPGATEEDDGVLMSLLTCANGASALVCLDARTFKEVGRAVLPFQVGYRFHGTFVPEF